MNKKPSLKQRRADLLDYLAAQGISDQVCGAFAAVPQEDFFDPIFADRLYTFERIPVGGGEKIDDLCDGPYDRHLQLKEK
jgi:protein-L-isoaspartate O-methyltransferase